MLWIAGLRHGPGSITDSLVEISRDFRVGLPHCAVAVARFSGWFRSLLRIAKQFEPAMNSVVSFIARGPAWQADFAPTGRCWIVNQQLTNAPPSSMKG